MITEAHSIKKADLGQDSNAQEQSLRFRQIHLDFHTSGAIDGVGSSFDKRHFQETLARAAVNSVTCFATCHHGWSYYDTKVGTRHPGLSFDLLRAQYDACKEAGINVPIYLTVGVNNLAADEHPEWRCMDAEGRFSGWCTSDLSPGFKMMSFFSPYMDHLCDQIKEVMELYPEVDGLFFDIINQPEDCSMWALQHMKEKGLDPLSEADRQQSRLDSLMLYYRRVTETVRGIDPHMRIFHNSGHITPGYRKVLPYFSHLELESLPTGGWGYDHFPMSAKYAQGLDMEYLGMTGKFHTTWGEFGGYKHPNALRYECCAMLANGARCSIGDQLHPVGRLDETAYDTIGEAYREVEVKEPFVNGAYNIADLAVIYSQSTWAEKAFREKLHQHSSDIGAARVLLEEHILFDMVDAEADISGYKMVILPEEAVMNSALEAKLKRYLEEGGKLMLCGDSGILDGEMCFDVGGEVGEESPYQPDFILPVPECCPDFLKEPMVMYTRSRRLTVGEGESLGDVYDPYFNRTWEHFCSHQHTPARPEPSGFACGAMHGNLLYLAHAAFSLYRFAGSVTSRQYLAKCVRKLLADDERLRLEGFPSTGRVTLMQQPRQQRYVMHLLYANTVNRGGPAEMNGGNVGGKEQQSFEVIEDLVPLYDIGLRLRLDESIKEVRLEPEGEPIEFTLRDGAVCLQLPRLLCHQMIAFYY